MKQKTHRNSLAPGHNLLWFRIERILGQGGFGITYLARDTNLAQPVAIKEFLPSGLVVRDSDSSIHPVSDKQGDDFKWGLQRFIAEAQTLAKFSHPNIVRIATVFEANNTAYMVMTYERGETLSQLLKRQKTLEEDHIRAIVLPIIDGLEQVHSAGFIHRDIKPANVMIRPDGSAVLIDFGSARQAFEGHTRSMTSVVSPGYAPFEQYYSKADRQGPWTDIYGLGATLYHCIAGAAPMDALARSESLLKAQQEAMVSAYEIGKGRYSASLLDAIDHALEFNEDDRPQTLAEWREEFAKAGLFRKRITPTEPDDFTRPGTRPFTDGPEPSRALTWLVSLCLVAALAGAGWLYREPMRVWLTQRGLMVGEPLAASDPSTSDPALAEERLQELRAAWSGEQAPAPPKAMAPAPPKVAPPKVDPEEAHIRELLKLAAVDVAAGRLTAPEGGNALQEYREVLRLQPGHPTAVDGVSGIIDRLLKLAEVALEEKRVEEAERHITKAESIDPSAATGTLKSELAELRRQQNNEQNKPDNRAQEWRSLLALAKQDLAADRVVAPAGNNAFEKFRQLKKIAGNTGAVKAGLIELGNRLMEMADQASSVDHFDRAYGYLDRAEQLLPERDEIRNAREFVDIRKIGHRGENKLPSSKPTTGVAAQPQVTEGAGPWGAIAFAPGGVHGAAWDHASRTSAQAEALAECQVRVSTCSVRSAFTDCAALASAPDGSFGWATRTTTQEAKAVALLQCHEHTEGLCTIVTDVCANGSHR